MLNQSTVDQVLQALADPTRRQIVELLSGGPQRLSDLAAPLPMSLPGVMQHVQVLERSGIVATEKHGRVRMCRLEVERLTMLEHWIAGRRQTWERRLDRLGEALSQPKGGPE
jgi:DNA-binding transcriptional ArsR family regulator